MRAAHWLRLGAALVLLAVVLPAVPGHAQTTGGPLVAFVTSSELETASVFDFRADGISRLEGIFRSLGARTTTIDLKNPIPADVRVVIIVRPLNRLSMIALARLWVYLQGGNALLLAVDPDGHLGAITELSSHGLPTLFTLDYGISLQDDFLVEPWFTLQTIDSLEKSFSRAYPDTVLHPVIAPLITYDLPVQLWGARSMLVEPLGPDSYAIPLVSTRTSYGEIDEIFARRNPAPFEFNLGKDSVGRLDVAALAENTATGSRIAVLGDSGMIQDGRGLAAVSGTGTPLFPGNRILTERIAAWLLGLPEDQWLELPEGFNWLAVDGNAEDWKNTSLVARDTPDDSPLPAHDLRQVRGLRDDDYLYLLAETAAPPDPMMGVQLILDTNNDRTVDATVNFAVDQVVLRGDQASEGILYDAALSIGSALELRLPLRVVGLTGQVMGLCLTSAEASGPLDCLDNTLTLNTIAAHSPADVRFVDHPMVAILTTSVVSLRAGPGTTYDRLATYGNGYVFEAIGRDETGNWFQVRNARYTGWVSADLVLANADLMLLPVAQTP